VAGVTKALFDVNGNIEDTSMTRLGGEFTMMLVAELPASATLTRLEKTLKPLEKRFALHIHTQAIPSRLARSGRQSPPQYMLSVYGTDKPGIIYRVAQTLADRRVSITDLNTKSIPQASGPLYVMLLEIQMPPGLDLDALRSDLDDLRKSLQVEITLQDIEAVAL